MNATCREKEEKIEGEGKGADTDSLSHFNFLSSVILSQCPSHCQTLLSAFHPVPGGFGDEVWR